MTRLTRRSVTTSIVGLTLAASLTGCGVGSSIVGLHDAPTERTDTAPLNVDGAESVAARVLDAATAARAQKGPAAAKAQAATLAGAALAQAKAQTALGAAAPSADPLQRASEPKVVAISQGKAWPRAILVGTLDEASKTQTLHVLMSTAAREQFKVYASVPMLPGTSVPAMGDLASGAKLVGAGSKGSMVASPTEALTAYAAGLDYPKPTASKVVGTSDAYASALKAATAAQVKSLGALATLTQKHAVAPGTLSFQLADGGAVVFGQLTRQDVIAAKPTAKQLGIPATYNKLVGKSVATKSLTVNNLENVILVIPTKGAATVVGADEQLVSAKAV